MKIEFCGASTGVTGSCHLLKTENHKVLMDCGQFQGGKIMEALNYEDFPFSPAELDCVLLSHAHIDHCGRLPLLVKRGFSNKIYCTSATADLLKVMLEDSAHIHEKDAEWLNHKNERLGRPMTEPLFTLDDVAATLKLVEPVLYDQLIEINDEMKVVFNDAGHILGSAIIEIFVRESGRDDEKETKIVFSGDLGMTDRPLLKDPTRIKSADCVIMESTYGNRNHTETAADIKKLVDIIIKTKKRGGSVIIPSFAVGRTQELIYQLNEFYENNEDYKADLEDVIVYIDSPMATTATEVFRRNSDVFDEDTREHILKGDDPLDFKNLKFTRSTDESKLLNANKTPKVIISASGMCEAGRIRHHLKHNLWDQRNSIIFVGYQAVGTLGRALEEGEKDVTILGEAIHVGAEIYDLEGFSAHADQNGLFAWLSGFEEPPRQVFLVHGEEDAKKDFAKLVNQKLGYEPIVVLGNSEYDIDTDDYTVRNLPDATKTGAGSEDLMRVRTQVSRIHSELEKILYNANLVMTDNMPEDKLTNVKNILQQLEKSAVNLGAAVNYDADGRAGEGDGDGEGEDASGIDA